MTRDMELIRKIIAEIQSWKDPLERKLKISDYDPNVVGRHVEMLIEAGYISGRVHHSSMGMELIPFVCDLTYEGHDLAAALLNDNVWAKLKQSLSPKELATLPLTIVKEAAVGVLKTSVLSVLTLGS